MSSLQRFFAPTVRLFDANIKSLPGAKLHFYKAGMGAGNEKATYQDKAGNVAHANPVVADSTGTFPSIFLSGLYKVELKNSADVTQTGWPIDNVGQDTVISPFAPWSEIVTYNTDDVVTSPDGDWYRSLVDDNLGDDPDDASGDWALIVIPVASNFISNVAWVTFSDSGTQISVDVRAAEAATIANLVSVGALAAHKYMISAARYAGDSFSVGSQATNPSDLAFNTAGTKMFVVGSDNDAVYEYALSTAFSISSASYSSVSFSVSSQDGSPFAMAFNTDGTKMFILGDSNDSVFEYALSTGFDLSTAAFTDSFDASAQTGIFRGLAFSADGAKMFICSSTGTALVYEYALSTAFDVSTASYSSVSFDTSSQDTAPGRIALSADGSKLFVSGEATDKIYEYDLSTAFSLATASYSGVSLDVSSQDATPRGIAFNATGTKLFLVGGTNDSIYEYTTSMIYLA